MPRVKSIIKYIINNIQSRLSINVLSKNEYEGQLNGAWFLKFFRGSKLAVPFSIGRTIRGVGFDKPELDPFSLCLEKQNMYNFNANIFGKDLYDICNSESNYLVRDFIKTLSNPEISSLPSWTIAFPWEENSFLDLKTHYPKLLANNRKSYTKTNIFDEDFSICYRELALSHGIQYQNLIAKILAEGFNEQYKRPRVYILKNKNNWRWVMAGDGNHRAYIMLSLKSLVLPIVIKKIVDRSKSNKWPNVVNGEYTQREAEHIFDTVFRGDSRIRGCF